LICNILELLLPKQYVANLNQSMDKPEKADFVVQIISNMSQC